MKIASKVYSVLTLFLLLACGEIESISDDTPPPPAVAAPSAATLVFPADNTECNEGVISSIDETKSAVTFQWNASENTDTYEVNLRNINTNTSTKSNSTTNDATITIDRGTPYEWFVVSKANGTNETASSVKAKFYNQGPGIENYAPFPAEAINPARGATIASATSVNLQWAASDIDDDIVGYTVFFGTNTNPTAELGTTEESNLNAPITSGTKYYWSVITTDSQNNSSTSEVFEFTVE
ncbi:hypothetical protein ACFLR9_08285 [Bacteroidota bacterium]